jgi:hypothetical protein
MTAVEWIISKLPMVNDNDPYLAELIKQAKEIEKQQQVYNKEIVDILDNVRYWETCPDEYKVFIEKFIEQFKKK